MTLLDIKSTPYTEWPSIALADPRRASQAQFAHGFAKILADEAPIQALNLFQTYAKAGGLLKIARPLRSQMERALLAMEKEGIVLIERENDSEADGPDDSCAWIVRLPAQERVVLRSLGPRGFSDIPLSELAVLVLEIRSADELMGREEIFRAVLDFYGLQKLTALVRRRLERVLAEYF